MRKALNQKHFSACQPEKDIENYLFRWDTLTDYVSQEQALNKIFLGEDAFRFSESELMVKCATLNDFYSTHILKIYYVVQHYLGVPDLENRVKTGDLSLVDDLRWVVMPGKLKRIDLYSFATKFCSHHNPMKFPICDTLAVQTLVNFRNRDGFTHFSKSDLRNYSLFVSIIDDFRQYYHLEKYSYKEIDKYLWQIGKELKVGEILFP